MNLVLVGFMGSGKTSVGRRVSRRLGYRFVDTDRFIEGELGCTIADLFATKGEPHFRELESRLARRLSALTNTVISTGGGMPVAPGNIEALRKAGVVVFLNADIDEITERLSRDAKRPKLKEGELRETVLRLHGERLPVYRQADVVVDTKGKSVNRVAGDVIRMAVEAMHAREAAEPAQVASDPAPSEVKPRSA